MEAAAGCEYVLHVASPFPATVPKNEDELITPAGKVRCACCAPPASASNSSASRVKPWRRAMPAARAPTLFGVAPGSRRSAVSTAASRASSPWGALPKSPRDSAATPFSSPRVIERFKYASKICGLLQPRSNSRGIAQLSELLPKRSSALPAEQRRLQLRRQLHRDRAGSAFMAAQILNGRRRQRSKVYPMMRIEAPVLRGDHRVLKRGGYPAQRRPIQHATTRIDPHLVQRLTISVEEQRVRPPMMRLNFIERRRTRSGPPKDQDGGAKSEKKSSPTKGMEYHGFTSTGARGISPNISGEYIASTRVAASEEPALLKRTVYSTVKEPFGTYS